VIGLKNILNTCKANKKLVFVFLSSVSLYKSSLRKINEKSDLKILSFYNLHKLFCEKMINYFINFSKNKFIILRLSNVYGDTDNKKRDFFLNSCLNIIKNNNLKIFSHGKYLRDFLHLDDVSKAILCIFRKNIRNKLEVYNLGYGKSYSINYLIKRIILNLKKRRIIYKGSIKFTKNESQLINRNFSTNASKFKKRFNWKPVISLDLGINKVISKIL
jgi:UDP-glucose 4-epimerase